MPDTVTRRDLLRICGIAGAACLVGGSMGAQVNPIAAADAVDHLLLGSPDLDAGIAWVKERTGLTAVFGGVHPNGGTRNALVSLGKRRYLEILAPDPAQTNYTFSIDVRKLKSPQLIAWAAASTDVAALGARLQATGVRIFGPFEGSRARPDGKTLKWRVVAVQHDLRNGMMDPIPFFIEWAPDSPHPSEDSPKGARLESVKFAHPDPAPVRKLLQDLGLDATVARASEARMTATIEAPKWKVELS